MSLESPDFSAPAEHIGGRRRYSGNDHSKSVDQSHSLQGNLTKMVWDAGRTQVEQAFSWYTNIDLFRPYFDVEPKSVRNRLLQSLLPRKPSKIIVPTDLYGPLMLILTMVALLIYSMKSSGYVSKDGTLIGTAFVTVFGYWIIASLAIFCLNYLFNNQINLLQTLSILGYALFGHCIVLALSSLLHTEHDHLYFYSLLLLFGGLSALRMALYFAFKTYDKTHKLIICCTVIGLHLTFLSYLHFGYHRVVEGSFIFIAIVTNASVA